jgi:filamentous hemagglutinin
MVVRLLRAALCYTLSVQLIQQPVMAHAQALKADSDGPMIDAAPNGVPLVNIVTPNAAGVSHNRFRDFNVGTEGVILNNSQAAGQSRLGGATYGNPALQQGAARLILNEVTGTSRSALAGPTEIFGRSADYILANPNGITCDGCGFINTPRATLTTGSPLLDPEGRLQGLSVSRGDIRIGPGGIDATNLDAFDLVARSVSLDGPVHTRDLGIAAGRLHFDYATRTATATGGHGEATGYAIDSRLLGGMYADRIHLIATDAGVGVRMAGDMASGAAGLTLSADGHISLAGAAASRGSLSVTSRSGALDVLGAVHGDGEAELDAADVLSVGDQASVTASGALTLRARSAVVDGALTAGTLASDGTQGPAADLSAAVEDALVLGGRLGSTGGMALTAGGATEVTTPGRIEAEGDVALTTGSLNHAGEIRSGGSLTIASGGAAVLSGSTASADATRPPPPI